MAYLRASYLAIFSIHLAGIIEQRLGVVKNPLNVGSQIGLVEELVAT